MDELSRKLSGLARSFGCGDAAHGRGRSRIVSRMAACIAIAVCAAGAAGGVEASEPGAAQIVVGPVLDIDQAETPFYLRVGGPAEAVPPGSFVLIEGLPQSLELSGAERAGPGTWAVSLAALEELTVKAPSGFAGASDILITLFDGAGTELAVRDVHLYARDLFAGGPENQPAEASPAGQGKIVTASVPAAVPTPVAQAEGPSDAGTSTAPRPTATASVPPPAAPPPPAHRPSASPDQLVQAQRLLEQGTGFLGQGNIAVARQYFARAAQLGSPMAALRMAETYDPYELERAKVHGPKANPAIARQWYQRAAHLGVAEAEDRLRRLGPGQ